MIDTIMLIMIFISVTAFGFLNFRKRLEMPIPHEQRLLSELKTDPLINDLMEYTMEKNLTCVVRPGIEDQQTLYYHDQTNHNEFVITELFSVDSPRGTKLYNQALDELKNRVNLFIDNKENIQKELREKANVKN